MKGLKNIFNVLKENGHLIPAIDKFLLTYKGGTESEDRTHSWNSPSSVGKCLRACFYTRMGEKASDDISPRLRRMFDNGHDMHDRIQGYLAKCGMLVLAECPIFNQAYQCAGHTDGLVKFGELQLAVLELKSIHTDGFRQLKEAQEDHIKQAQVYMLFIELLRQELQKYKTKLKYNIYKNKLLKKYREFLETFVESGRKYTKEEKIAFHLDSYRVLLDVLWKCQKPIKTMFILYEDKNTQELKEFKVEWDDELVKAIKLQYNFLNDCVANNKAPARPKQAEGKSSRYCAKCKYRQKCWH